VAYTVFPASVYDQPRNLLSVLGSWWATDYAGNEQVAAIVAGRAHVERQSIMNILELIASMSRFSVPIYHTETWYPLYLRKSQCNTVDASIDLYDTGVVYDGGTRYDVPHINTLFSFPKPTDLVSIPMLLNRFVAPSLTQLQDVDYAVSSSAIMFCKNPFDDTRVAKRMIYDNGVLVDEEAVLWVFRGEFDWETTYQQFGYVIGLHLASSKGYNDLLNAIYNSITGGMTLTALRTAMSAMTGIPLVEEAVETVTDVVPTAACLMVITDKHVYKYAATATPTVVIGQAVQRGQALTDALQISELNTGKISDTVTALTIGRGILANCFYGELLFENRDVPLVVDTNHPSGYTYVSWGLGGFILDVQHFFDEIHERGIAESLIPVDPCQPVATITYADSECNSADITRRRGTLAHLLDNRPVAVGEPTAVNLPTTINPLRFLVENVLRNNVIFVQLQANGSTAGALGLQHYQLLRKVIPPNVAVLILVEVELPPDTVDSTWLTETVSTFDGIEPISETVTSVTDSDVQLRVVSGTCQ